ncbi:hypothetical protein DOTSEDRAFT_181186 [Dothistroma septosporum NZE10]|uniref:Enoyl reductase (ER) domain-containing protein n=1 Tax=Dothistroma septosporum (strain NZE10 / CBS 128990) TaxID=675120 RepID=M2XHX4_DOTSN|nr:hypothetical protein DOTSEDRAFT_181186 [Dothistroma septosporum NZE10]
MGSKCFAINSFFFDPKTEQFSEKVGKRELGLNEIAIQITHSGICYTDVHAKHMNQAISLGHEGVGNVVAIGPAVTQHKEGDRVGWGWLRQSCKHCECCVTGYRQYCAEAKGFAFCDHGQGAFGDSHIIDADFAYRIPEGIESRDAAPLMCAGASVFEALDAAGTNSSDRVGVVGVGGLGHMAILFAKAMGCGVTALTRDLGKREDAERLGADEVLDLTNLPDAVETGPGRINTLLVTSNTVPSLAMILPLLARRATVVLMTIQQHSFEVPYMPFILPGHRIIASTEASRENHIRMLEFAARHGIKPWIEEFDMTKEGLEEAFGKLEGGGMRFRGVVKRVEGQENHTGAVGTEFRG